MGTLRAFLAGSILASLACGAELKITLLATTDLHGNLFPYDYYTAHRLSGAWRKSRRSSKRRGPRIPTTC